ncbi:MAG: small basic family protein [Clostridiales bacterium]|nr:small basic family protein [Clostridiales bacterium]
MLIGFAGIVLGLLIGFFFPIYFPDSLSLYMGVALIACVDSIIGGLLAKMRGTYSESVFISGFFINALLAALLTYFGKRINLQLELAAMVVFTTRIYQNLAILRRNLLNLEPD